MEIHPAAQPKRVLVVGGGPGGMEAARVAAMRGHHVILCERSGQLGGMVSVAAKDPRQRNLAFATAYRARELGKLGVEVRLGTEIDAAAIETLGADAVVVATGSVPHAVGPTATGSPTVVSAWAVLSGEAAPGHRVCVVAAFNGYKEPASFAEWLVDRGHEVEILTERMFVGESQDPGTNHNQLRRLKQKRVAMHTLTGFRAVDDGQVVVYDCLTREERKLQGFDTVVLAGQHRAEDRLLRALRASGRQLYAVGDCVAPRRILNAVMEGYRAALAI